MIDCNEIIPLTGEWIKEIMFVTEPEVTTLEDNKTKVIYLEDYRSITYPVGSCPRSLKDGVNSYIQTFRRNFPVGNYNLWCRGSSGAIIAGCFSILQTSCNFMICHIKKDGESSHGNSTPDYNETYKNIVIDDFVSSGDTIDEIATKILELGLSLDILIVGEGDRYIRNYGNGFQYLLTNK